MGFSWGKMRVSEGPGVAGREGRAGGPPKGEEHAVECGGSSVRRIGC